MMFTFFILICDFFNKTSKMSDGQSRSIGYKYKKIAENKNKIE